MDKTPRYLEHYVVSDLQKKMVLLAGPRQVGKTTMAQQIGKKQYRAPVYFNWDDYDDRQSILHQTFDQEADLLIFDELHKYVRWKNYLKGLYDKHSDQFAMLITGSARLDVYRRGGDSMMGRYHHYRLHPFSVAELLHTTIPLDQVGQELTFPNRSQVSYNAYSTLLQFGGFPEPLFSKNERTLRRWQKQRVERLVQEDIRDIENIRQLSLLEVLIQLLPDRVSSVLSLNSLKEDLQLNHSTITHWMDILERFYYHFRLRPFANTVTRSLHKEPKLYLWDWSEVKDVAKRLENMVAAHLLKFIHALEDVGGYHARLWYLRDRVGREVDFLVTIDQKPWFAVEVKQTDENISPQLEYFGSRLKIPYLFQVVATPGLDQQPKKIRLMSVDKFLSGLL